MYFLTFKSGLIYILFLFLIGCGGSNSSSDENQKTSGLHFESLISMCSRVLNSTINISCTENKIQNCRDIQPLNKTLAQYEYLEVCENDKETVVNNFQSTGRMIPGPNAINKTLACDINENYNGDSKKIAYSCNDACNAINNNNPLLTLAENCQQLNNISSSKIADCKVDCGSLNGGGSCNINTVWLGAADDHARFYCIDACNWSNTGGPNAQQAIEVNCNNLSNFGAQGDCNFSCN